MGFAGSTGLPPAGRKSPSGDREEGTAPGSFEGRDRRAINLRVELEHLRSITKEKEYQMQSVLARRQSSENELAAVLVQKTALEAELAEHRHLLETAQARQQAELHSVAQSHQQLLEAEQATHRAALECAAQKHLAELEVEKKKAGLEAENAAALAQQLKKALEEVSGGKEEMKGGLQAEQDEERRAAHVALAAQAAYRQVLETVREQDRHAAQTANKKSEEELEVLHEKVWGNQSKQEGHKHKVSQELIELEFLRIQRMMNNDFTNASH